MKNIKDKINEKLQVSNSKTASTLLQKIEFALPELEKEIKKKLGNDANNFDFELTVDEKTDRRNETIYTINSGNLIELTGPIGKTIYESFIFNTWGGNKVPDENKIWFNPKFSFRYVKGGSNGTEAIWNSIWFDIDEEEWIFR